MKENIAAKARKVVEEEIVKLGYYIWDLTYQKEGDEWVLSVEIDADKPIDLDDCIKVNDAIEPLIDEADLIENAYSFEVASAGLERDLKTDLHYEYAVRHGAEVSFKLYAPIEKSKTLTGKIAAFSDSEVAVELPGGTVISVPKKNIAKAHISL